MGFHSPSIKGTHFGLRFFGRGFFFFSGLWKESINKNHQGKVLGIQKGDVWLLDCFFKAITTGILSCILFWLACMKCKTIWMTCTFSTPFASSRHFRAARKVKGLFTWLNVRRSHSSRSLQKWEWIPYRNLPIFFWFWTCCKIKPSKGSKYP